MRIISPRDLRRRMQENGVLVVNTLDPATYLRAHIPGSYNIPLSYGDFEERVERLTGGRDREIVVHCANPETRTSAKAARRLEEAGFENVQRFRDGIAGWTLQGYPVETGIPSDL